MTTHIKLVMRLRPIKWFFKRNWYSIRWNVLFFNRRYYLLDIGALTVGCVFIENDSTKWICHKTLLIDSFFLGLESIRRRLK